MSENKEIKKEKTNEFLIGDFKTKYGEDNIKEFSLPLDDLGKEYLDVIIKVPERKVITTYLLYIDKSMEKAFDTLIANCLLTNKDTVMNDDNLYFSCANAIAGLIKVREAKIKK